MTNAPVKQAPAAQTAKPVFKKSTPKNNIPGVPSKVKQALGKRGIEVSSE